MKEVVKELLHFWFNMALILVMGTGIGCVMVQAYIMFSYPGILILGFVMGYVIQYCVLVDQILYVERIIKRMKH